MMLLGMKQTHLFPTFAAVIVMLVYPKLANGENSPVYGYNQGREEFIAEIEQYDSSSTTSELVWMSDNDMITNSEAYSDLRLPGSILPRLYEISLLPHIIEDNFTTEGSVDIYVECVDDTDNITLHIDRQNIFYQPSSIKLKDLTLDRAMGISGVIEEQADQFLIIFPDTLLERGNWYKLSIEFTSLLRDDLRGFYRSSYLENGQVKYLAISQMQPTDARKAFPCFDEPNLKANFKIRLGRHETKSSVSNMPIIETVPIDGRPGFVWDIYEESLPMSTYLVGLFVGEFDYLVSSESNQTPFHMWARPEFINQTEYASRIGPQVLKFFEDYFQIAFPLPKQDMLAIPDLSFSGMENWGMITYRESAILFDPVKSSESDKQQIVSIIAHELAHSWFGDLVTMNWWSDLWLNEGFASYMQYLGGNHVEPSFEMLPQIVIDNIHDVFSVDALETSHPISIQVNDPEQINELFDRISYEKGASLLRMLNKFLGDSTFRAGLTNYLNSQKYSNAVQDDLWSALTQQAVSDSIDLPVDVATIMETWTLKMGFPLITVIRDYNSSVVNISQERFLLIANSKSSDETVYRWWVPLTYTSNFSAPHQQTWLPYERNSIQVNSPVTDNQWLIFNVDQVGYYRVNYDITNWRLIITQLLSNHREISVINRAQLIDDSLNIARVSGLPYATALSLIDYLAKEVEYLPWRSALNGLEYVDLMLSRAEGYHYFKAYVSDLIKPVYEYVGFNDRVDDSHMLIYTRIAVLEWACKLNVGNCAGNAIDSYKAWMNDPSNHSIISPNLMAIVVCTAIANGGDAEWNFAYERYLDSNLASEKEILLYAVSCTRNQPTLIKLLEWSLNSTSGIRRQDASSVFSNVAKNVVGRNIIFDFLRNRWEDTANYFSSLYDLSRIIDSVCVGFNSQWETNELKQFRADHEDEMGTADRAVIQAIERAEANTNWMKLHYQEVTDWLQEQNLRSP